MRWTYSNDTLVFSLSDAAATGTLGFLPRPFFLGTLGSLPDLDSKEPIDGVAIIGTPWAVGEGGTLENGFEGIYVGVDGVAGSGVDGPCDVGVVGIVRVGGAPDGEARGVAAPIEGDRVGLSDGLLSSPLFFLGLII
jgi:hypothetical protein